LILAGDKKTRKKGRWQIGRGKRGATDAWDET